MITVVLTTDIKEYPLLTRGKIRDVYDMDDKLLIIATDRISAFDWVLPSAIPGKGAILNSMSLFWFSFIKDIVPNHVLVSDFNDYPQNLKPYRDQLLGRSMIVRRAKRIDIECVARGYLVGSGYKDYSDLVKSAGNSKTVNLYGYELPTDLKVADKLPEPIFTPATKEESGHDQNISYLKMSKFVGDDVASQLRDITLAIYSKAANYALEKGVIIADTKFEFGFIDNRICIIDEILSPDSSRFWPIDSYAPGISPPSFDKQFIRDWLEKSGWDKNSPPPELPADVIAKTLEKYKLAHKILVGTDIN